MSTAPNEIAEGHNLERLTNAQVGVPEWRLLTEEEIREAGSANVHFVQGIQVFDDPRWIFDAVGFRGNEFDATYRTNLSRAELRKARGLEPEPKESTRCQHGFFGQCDKCDREASERTSHILRSLSEVSEIAGDCRGRVLRLEKALDEERAAHEKTRQELERITRIAALRSRLMEVAERAFKEGNGYGVGCTDLWPASETFKSLQPKV